MTCAVDSFHAVVIGGGPAGALASRLLAQHGWRIALIESKPRHRPKTCGHCLNARAMDLLARHDLLERTRGIAVGKSRHLRVQSPHCSPLLTTLEYRDHDGPTTTGAGLLAPRNMFDQMLVDAARESGVTVFQPASARVQSLEDGGTVIQVRQSGRSIHVRTSLLIGADGVGSGVAKAAGLAANARIGQAFGFSFDTQVKPEAAIDCDVIDMVVIPNGYLGMVRQNDGVAHCAGLIWPVCPRRQRSPLHFSADVLSRFTDHAGALQSVLQGPVSNLVAAGPLPWRPRSIVNDRVALIGDAAGYVEPFTGEGMSWALHSAAILAQALSDAQPGQWNLNLARRYRCLWSKEIGRRQIACRALAFALARPRLLGLLLRAGHAHPACPRRLAQWMHA